LRRVAVIVVTVSLLGMATILTTALPASATSCPTPVSGTWIGSWSTNTPPSFAGAAQSELVFTQVGNDFTWSGTMTFVTGSNFVFAGPVSGMVTCNTMTGVGTVTGTIVSSPMNVMITGGTISPDGTDIVGGTFVGTQTGVFSSGFVTQSVSSPTSMATMLTTPAYGAGTTSATPLQASVTSPTPGQLSIGQAMEATTTSGGYWISGQVVQIVAPPASLMMPLTITFEVDSSLLSMGPLTVYHNGMALNFCVGVVPPLVVGNDPCIVSVAPITTGDLVTVLSSSASIWTIGVLATAPSAPKSPSAVPGNGVATIHWTKPLMSGGPPITGYRVTPYINFTPQAAQTFNSPATTATLVGLRNGQTYRFKVAAINMVNPGLPSSVSNAVTVGAPTAPRSLSATAGHTQAKLKWIAPASTDGSAITKYVITPYKAGVAQPSVPINPTTTTTITGLTSGKTYTFTIAAKNARGTGPPSAASNSITPT
jgi:hypothetical protein